MTIEWFRDLVLVIAGLGVTVAIITIVVLAVMLYRHLVPILDSARKTTKSVERLTTCVEAEVAGPLSQLVSFIQGVRQVTGLFSKFTRKKEDD